ncbi:MAG TPA: anti-sigma factor [Nitrospirales bacterium]|nr:anti-sigma factor [Nitrospirales bacterium]
MDHEQLEESLSLYALGTLEPESAGEVHAHLATGCPRCSALLRQYQSTTTTLPYALAPQAPPADLKSRIMAAISGRSAPAPTAPVDLPTAKPDVQPVKAAPAELSSAKPDVPPLPSSPRRRRTWWSSPALATALGGLLVGTGASFYYLYDTNETEREAYIENRLALTKADNKIADLERQVAERQKSLAKATDELNRTIQALRTTHELLARHQEQIEILQASRPGKGAEDIARILSSPTTKMADLRGTDMAKDAYALVFMEPDTHRGFFYANNLPELPAGKTYQLWVITDKPVSAGLFSIDRGRKGRVMMRDVPVIANIKQFAVSMEPDGGRPQPSGSIYLAGSM